MNIIESIYDGLKLDRLTMDRLTHKIKNKVPLKSGRAIREIYEQPSIAAPELDILIIGARWGPYTPLQNIKWLSDPNIIGVEPDTEECYRLNKKYPECNFYPIALGNKTGQSQLYLTKKGLGLVYISLTTAYSKIMDMRLMSINWMKKSKFKPLH